MQFGQQECAAKLVIKWFGVQEWEGMDIKTKQFGEVNNKWNE